MANKNYHIEIKHLKKDFLKSDSSKLEVLSDVNLNITKGEFITIFGPNGSGKTTILNIIAGVLKPTSGEVSFNVEKPKIGYIFQDSKSSLLLWKKVWYNIGISKIWDNEDRDTIKQEVTDLVNSLKIDIDLNAYPFTLSGGQLQLVSILRSIYAEPDILLLDEPFSALDYLNKLKIQLEIQRISSKYNLTCIMISHDIDEAIFVGDKIVLLSSMPTKINNVINNKVERPRSLKYLSSELFADTKKRIIELLNASGLLK